MSTIFTRIINGEIPGHFVWKDPICVAFADINPIQPGHVLVVPRVEVENFWEADPNLVAHLAKVSRLIGGAQRQAFHTARACQMIAGFDVPHLHIHSVPANEMSDFNPALASPREGTEIAADMEKLRQVLAEFGAEAAAAMEAATAPRP